MSPFDFKAALLARHAQHVVLIHFPIALFITAAVSDFVAAWKKNAKLALVAYYNVVAAAITALPAVATGVLAWQLQFGGKTPRGALRLHLALALLSSSTIWLVWYLHRRDRYEFASEASRIRLACELAATFLIALTGHLGGFLSGVNGPV